MNRSSRLAYRLLAALEDFYIHPEDYSSPRWNPKYQPSDEIQEQHQRLRVVNHPKTKERLENWFSKRKIPIRVVFADPNDIRAISKPGTITFQYSSETTQHPPTAWIIVHNLSHAIHEPYNFYSDNPKVPQNPFENRYKLIQDMVKHYNLMGGNDPENPTYPTTKSYQNGKIEDPNEAFHEIFTQWVSTGKIEFQPSSPQNIQKAKQLTSYFRQQVDYLADIGAVLHNEG